MPGSDTPIGRDRSKIDLQDPDEAEAVHRKYPTLSYREVMDAMLAAGPHREDIYQHIEENNKDLKSK